MWYSYYSTIYHCGNAEITPELCDDLIKFSFDNVQDTLSTNPDAPSAILFFIPVFLSGLRKLV